VPVHKRGRKESEVIKKGFKFVSAEDRSKGRQSEVEETRNSAPQALA
jgi:hypothetical protein